VIRKAQSQVAATMAIASFGSIKAIAISSSGTRSNKLAVTVSR
jgi:hypothetical protein